MATNWDFWTLSEKVLFYHVEYEIDIVLKCGFVKESLDLLVSTLSP